MQAGELRSEGFAVTWAVASINAKDAQKLMEVERAGVSSERVEDFKSRHGDPLSDTSRIGPAQAGLGDRLESSAFPLESTFRVPVSVPSTAPGADKSFVVLSEDYGI